jgi:hypothetical protein
VARILDTTPSFEAFARSAFLESPHVREAWWEERYEAAHPEAFAAFYAVEPERDGRAALAGDLSRVRQVANRAAPVMSRLITEVEPEVAGALGMETSPLPRHVLMVGPMSTNAAVGCIDGEVTLFHCLEWFQDGEGARVLVAHEDAHAFHRTRLDGPVPADAAWTAFYEGLAARVSRAVVPGRPEEDYFWYGREGFSAWLPWCREHRDELVERFRTTLDDPETGETFFGSGLIDGRWRVGYYLADDLVGRLGRSLPDLVAMTADEGRSAVRDALSA